MKQLTISTDEFKGKNIISISVNAAKTGANSTTVVSASCGGTTAESRELTTNFVDYSFDFNEVASDDIKIIFDNPYSTTGKNSKNGGCKFHSITVVYSDEVIAPSNVATPVITLDEATNMVSIACDTEDAEIFYTLNDEIPSAEATKYDGEFEITRKCTVKAIAIKGEEKSNIASKTFNITTVLKSLAGWTDLAKDEAVIIKCPLTVTYNYNSYIFVTDEQGNYALVFDKNVKSSTYANGDIINGLEGKMDIYSGQPEIVPTTYGEKTTGNTVLPVAGSVADVAPAKMSCYMTIANVTIAAVTDVKKTYTITDENDATATLYNQFNIDMPADESKIYTIIGVVGAHTDNNNVTTYQIQPIEITEVLPEGAFEYTVDGIGEDGDVTLVDGKAEITFSGVHKEVKIYFKHEVAAATEPVVRKALDHSGFEVAAYDEAADTHKITLTQPGTLTYYAAHDASGNAEDPKTITVKASEPTTGIGSIAADDAEGNVEYFNLQGIKVNIDNAAPGLYIRRQGNTVSKVIK